mmetsp:Transcript_33431/g.40417  ORF Transcript_33431/g.40417 Transcript_33431/m.40417 type:complete len:456 (-) Transcript_33431:72-1439(-)
MSQQLQSKGETLEAVNKELGELRSAKSQLEVNLMEGQNALATSKRKVEELEAKEKSFDAVQAQVKSLSLELRKESVLRKKAHNALRELKGNIRVCARVRPGPLPGTSGAEGSSQAESLSVVDEYSLALEVEAKGMEHTSTSASPEVRRYEYDAVFLPEATQEMVYEEAKDMVQSALDGYNVCIFCYGQTGSGKTHTMLGMEGSEGLLPRAIRDVFTMGGGKVEIQCYMLELYQDSLIDLLLKPGTQPPKLLIRRDASGTVSVEGANVLTATDSTELSSHLHAGLSHRKVAATKMNSQSSRSHLIFSVLIRHSDSAGKMTTGKMTFIDLAGSERVAKSGAINDAERLNEAKAINKSLSALGDVVSALTTGESFIPYRNHPLTQLMADSLGGNAKCCMVVNVSPLASDSPETRNSLDYASRVKMVKNEASKSVETKEIMKLKAIIEKQAAELKSLRN